MSRRLDWDKAKSDKLKGMASEPADVDMRHEPEHQAWWYGKNGMQRAASKESLKRQMAEAFSRGNPAVKKRPKEVMDAFISPKIKTLLEQVRKKTQKREHISQTLFSHSKTKSKTVKAKR